MSRVHAERTGVVEARIEQVYAFLRDYRQTRPALLTDHYRDYAVEAGGAGAGTVITYRFPAGRRERRYRLVIEEPTPGRTLRERDTESSFVTNWLLTPSGDGDRTQVELSSDWTGGSGIGGFFERRFAPAGLGRIYARVLANLRQAAAKDAQTSG